jgi:hypothetical protein
MTLTRAQRRFLEQSLAAQRTKQMDEIDTSAEAVAKRLERLGSLAERGWIDGDVVDLVHALSAERDQLAARLAEARDAAGDGHASDCATHNEPAMPNGPCDCGASSAITMREAAAKVAETEALWRPQWDGQPSYYAIAATIRSLPLPPDTRDGEIAELRAMNKLLHAANAEFAENMTTVSGDGEPTKADMCATISALRSAVAQQRLGSQRGQVVAATAAFQPLVTK